MRLLWPVSGGDQPTEATIGRLAGEKEVAFRKALLPKPIAMSIRKKRRGMSTTQYATVAALIALAAVAGVTLVGSRTNTKLGQTASDVGNPAALTQRFGS